MLRWVVVLLVVANALTWAYQNGHLQSLGWAPTDPREPERLAAQVSPNKLEWRVAGIERGVPSQAATEATADPSPAAEPTSCWQASGYAANQVDGLKQVLAEPGVPSGWALEDNVLPARWVVYLGKFGNTDALQRRKAELRQAKVEFRDVNNPSLQPGLALGTFSSEEAAQQALQDVLKAGVRGAKVAQERSETRTYTLKWPALTVTDRERLNPLKPALAGKNLQECP